MSRAVHYHTERTEIAFTHDNQEHVVSLLPYLDYPDEAVAVVYEIWNESTLEEESRWLVQTAGEKVDLVHEGIMHHVDRLDGANKEVTLLAEDDAVHVTIVAELLGPGVVVHSSKIDVSPVDTTEDGIWLNKSVTLEGGDSADDIEAVILLTRKQDLSYGIMNVGCRGFGSTSSRLWHQAYHSCNQWYPTAAPAGAYQIWVDNFTGKGSWGLGAYWWELGYIKKGHGFHAILNWIDEGPSSETSWVTSTASSQVPNGADGMFAVQRDVSDQIVGPEMGLWWHGLRAIGSSDIERICPSVQPNDSADPVKLDGQKQYRYFQPDDPELYILAYTMLAEVSGSGLVGEPEVESIMTGIPAVESVMTAIPEVESVMTGRPAIGGG